MDVVPGRFERSAIGLTSGVGSEAASVDHAVGAKCFHQSVDGGGDVPVGVLAGGWDGGEFDDGVGVFCHFEDVRVFFGQALEGASQVVDDDLGVRECLDVWEKSRGIFGFEVELDR